MKVDTNNCRTVEEELEYIEGQMECIGNFFVCDVHPNVVKAYHTSFDRLCRKRCNLIKSPEFRYYQLSNHPETGTDWLPQEVLDKMDPYRE